MLASIAFITIMFLQPAQAQLLKLEVVYAEWKEVDDAGGQPPRNFQKVCEVSLSLNVGDQKASTGKKTDCLEMKLEASANSCRGDVVELVTEMRVKALSEKDSDRYPSISSFRDKTYKANEWHMVSSVTREGAVHGFLIRIAETKSPRP